MPHIGSSSASAWFRPDIAYAAGVKRRAPRAGAGKRVAARAMKLLHVVPEDGMGGVEVAAKSAAGRPDLGCDVSMLFFLSDRGAARTGLADRLGFLSWRTLSAYPRAFRAIRRRGAEVIVFSLWKSVPLLIAARFLLRARVVYFLHLEVPTHRIDAWLSQLAIRLAHGVWADSEATLRGRGVAAGKPARVISFVTERLEPIAPPRLAPRFVSWGRLSEQKGLDRAVELIALLAARGVDASFTAYGRDDGERAGLVALAERLGVADRVSFPGQVAREERARAAADNAFFLQLSRYEGMCMGAVEGMQLGLVPVATAVGQMAVYVRDRETGLAVDPADLPRAADALIALLADPDRYAALSQAARRWWRDAPLYAEDVCRAARELVFKPSTDASRSRAALNE